MPEMTEPTEDMNAAIGPDIDIPGPYPSAHGNPARESDPSEQEPRKGTREAGSLGKLTKQTSTSTMREETGGLGSPIYDEARDPE